MARGALFALVHVLAASVLAFEPSPSEHAQDLTKRFEPQGDLHFPLHARGTNKDGTKPVYKDANADVETRVEDLVARMTLEEKVSQLIQGDLNGWMNMTDAYDNTLTYNSTGLADMVSRRGGFIWAGYLTPFPKLTYAITVGQDYMMHNTTLGIPAIFQSEGNHGFIDNGTIFPSPVGMAATFDYDLIKKAAGVIGDEAEVLGVTQLFAPVLDLARELRWGRVEEGFGEDHYLTGEMAHAYVTGLQSGRRRSTSGTALARVAAQCKHFAAFGSPFNGLNLSPVSGGERELRSMYLPPFKRGCIDAGVLSFMSAYSSYDGVPALANTHLLTDILRKEWDFKYHVISDAGGVDLLYTLHGVCPPVPSSLTPASPGYADALLKARECAAKTTVENYNTEMGGGTYTFETLVSQVKAGKVDVKYIDETVRSVLRTKFVLGLFENPYPYKDYASKVRTTAAQKILHQIDQEQLVLLENRNAANLSLTTSPLLPLDASKLGSIAILGPQAARVSLGDYVFENAQNQSISPLAGIQAFLSSKKSSTTVNYAEGAKLWSSDESMIPEAVEAAKKSDVAVVFVGTWTLDQQHLWLPNTDALGNPVSNATTGEHNDISDLGLVGASRKLVQAVVATGKPTVVVFVSGKPVAEPWIAAHATAIIQQFYPGELGGTALAELLFGAFSPSGKLPVSYPRSVGTAPAFYNYLKGGRPIDPGMVMDDGKMMFGHQYVLDSPVPLWSFGHGLSYVNFTYSDIHLSRSTIGRTDNAAVQISVRNNGAVKAKEVVQVYATDLVSSAVTSATQLVGFVKVEIGPNSSKRVTIPVSNDALKMWTAQGKWEVEAGEFNLRVGTSDQTWASAVLTVA